MARTYESFYLVTVAHGRQGQIPYQYPPASANPEASTKLPPAKDLIALCFPDLGEVKKTRALDFKAPIPDRATTTAGSLLASATATVASATGSSSSALNSPTTREPANAKPGFQAGISNFTLIDPDGGRLFGIVYRSLPNGFGTRYDVGKRYPECLVFVTRHAHALPMFQQVLLFIHSMRLVLAPIDRIEWALSGLYNRALPSPNEAVVLKQPLPKGHSRTYRFVWPAEGDFSTGDSVSALYLFQQLKPKSFVNLITAIITERRICFMASDMDKLSCCVHAALSLVYPFVWQHALVPVLSPSIGGYANSTSPIIFGIRRQHLPMLSKIVTTDVIYVDLDNGEISWQEHAAPIPDIFILPNTSQVVQAAQKLGVEATKAAEKLDKAFNKGMSLLQKYTGQQLVKDSEEPKPDAANTLAWDLTLLSNGRQNNPIPWSGKGRPAKTDKAILGDEQTLRDSLLAFMIAIVGDASLYLRPGANGRLSLDKDFYLGSRGMLGDGPALSGFLEQMVESSLFERFVEMRRVQVSNDRERISSPRSDDGSSRAQQGVFLRIVESLKQRAEQFTTSNIKKALKASQKEAASGSGVEGGGSETSGRWTVFHEGALQLTSNYAVTSDAQKALNTLVEDSFSSALLPSIMRTIWSRLNDCKGLNWRHASKGLTLLRELLIRGPEQVLSDTLANVGVLRAFLEYRSGMGLGQGNKVKETAREVFFLALDGKHYLLLRSVCAAGKKRFSQPRIRLTFEHALSTTFGDLHRVVVPTEGPQQAPTGPSRAGQEGASSSLSEDVCGEDLVDTGGDLSALEGGEDEPPGPPGRLGQMTSDGPIGRRSSLSDAGSPTMNKPASGRWENFDSGSGPTPSAAPSGPQAQWVNFGSNGGSSGAAQAGGSAGWETFSEPPKKPERRNSGAAPPEGSVSPPLIQLSTSPPPPPAPVSLPPTMPPLQAQRPQQPPMAAYPAAPQQQYPGYAMPPQQQQPGMARGPVMYPTASGPPAYGAPPYGGYPQAPQPGGQPMGGVGLMAPQQQPYSANYDPFAGLDKDT